MLWFSAELLVVIANIFNFNLKKWFTTQPVCISSVPYSYIEQKKKTDKLKIRILTEDDSWREEEPRTNETRTEEYVDIKKHEEKTPHNWQHKKPWTKTTRQPHTNLTEDTISTMHAIMGLPKIGTPDNADQRISRKIQLILISSLPCRLQLRCLLLLPRAARRCPPAGLSLQPGPEDRAASGDQESDVRRGCQDAEEGAGVLRGGWTTEERTTEERRLSRHKSNKRIIE